MPKPDNALEALGFLLSHVMVETMTALELYGGCCDRCCGACLALQWYRDNPPAAQAADEALRSIWDGTEMDRWEFQRPDGGVDWRVIEEAWVNSDRRGCHSSANTSPGIEPSTEETAA